MEEEPPVDRVYTTWKGRNKFFCGGKLMSGPDLKNLLLTDVLTIPWVVWFLASPAVDLVDLLDNGVWVPIVATSLFFINMVFLHITGFIDPGIVPRLPGSQPAGLYYRNCPPGVQTIVAHGKKVEMRFCDTCKIYRPPRCVHCHICNNCVESFDHHCPWVGNCVGKRNYVTFTVFLWTIVALCGLVFSLCIVHMVKRTSEEQADDPSLDKGPAFKKVLETDPSSLIICVYSGVVFLSVTGLCGFHIFLVCRGQTTYEQLKQYYPHGSPFSEGPCHNFKRLCCRLPAKKHFHNRRKVVGPDLRPRDSPLVTMIEPVVEEVEEEPPVIRTVDIDLEDSVVGMQMVDME